MNNKRTDHELIIMLELSRNKSAPHRTKPSRACRSVLPFMRIGETVLDYGCGKGFDSQYLTEMGLDVLSYDPYFPGKNIKKESDWCLLFYVINVIEDLAEREYVLLNAYQLARKWLGVGVTPHDEMTNKAIPYGDGRITSINTFFTSYDAQRAKRYIRAVLGLQPILTDSVLLMPSEIGEPIAHFELSRPELQERMEDYRREIIELRRSPYVWGDDCTLQPYQTRGVMRYRVFSESGQAEGKKFLYAGTGEPWGWVMDRFVNRDRLHILQDRLQYCREILPHL